MKRLIAVALAFASCASVNAAPAADQSLDKDACVFINSISSFRVLASDTVVLVSPGGKHMYLVKLAMPLPELKYATRYAYIDRDSDGQLCGRARDRIAVADPAVSGMNLPSTIIAMTHLDAEQIAALESEYDVTLTRKQRSQPEATE